MTLNILFCWYANNVNESFLRFFRCRNEPNWLSLHKIWMARMKMKHFIICWTALLVHCNLLNLLPFLMSFYLLSCLIVRVLYRLLKQAVFGYLKRKLTETGLHQFSFPQCYKPERNWSLHQLTVDWTFTACLFKLKGYVCLLRLQRWSTWSSRAQFTERQAETLMTQGRQHLHRYNY